jgi:hypothetical protein
MSNPPGPDQPVEATQPAAHATGDVGETEDTQAAEALTDPEHEPATEIMPPAHAEEPQPADETEQEPERRFTAPSNFDAGATQKIEPQADPATEVMPPLSRKFAPQLIPGRSAKTPRNRRSWGWVVALLLVIAALVAVAILGTVLLTRNSASKTSGTDPVVVGDPPICQPIAA